VIIMGCSVTGAGVMHPRGTSLSLGILNIAYPPLNWTRL
jgi:hypothetical protein